jgi:DNA-binding MarR family transcriptional regulator/ribosomal protein S18 acetylase RimI-like enzyme
MQVEAVRRFNRFYTGRIGALRGGLLGSPYPLPEARLIYELGRRRRCTASELGRSLELDAGYLSRLVGSLRRRGVLGSKRSAADARASVLSLTGAGRKAFALLDRRSRAEVSAMLDALSAPDQDRLVGAMRTVESLLSAAKRPEALLRGPRAGDFGWVVQAHGELYAREYGWGERFEALVAEIVARFVAAQSGPAPSTPAFAARRSRCWIAELDGERVGSVFVVPASKRVAQLRLLLVDPRARGRGLGKRLVRECIAFAAAQGYRKLVLWTQSNLAAARAIYRDCGFVLAKREPHAAFGVKLTGEYWEKALSRRPL